MAHHFHAISTNLSMWTYGKMDKHCTYNIHNLQNVIFKESNSILKEKMSKISVDLIRLVQCLTVVSAVMNMHSPPNARNSERQAASERGIWSMEILYFYNDIGLLQGHRNPGHLNSVRRLFVGS